MQILKIGALALFASLAVAQMAQAQGALEPSGAPAGWVLPAELASKRLSDDALKSSSGDFETLLKNTPGDNGRIPGVTESFVLTSPSSLPQVLNYAGQSATNEEVSAIGLGLCTTTSSLMNAANNPASPPAQSQAARDLARTILSSVAAASQASARTNQAISTSFGVSVNANGGVAVTCKALDGEVVATTAVAAAAASSSAGLGSPVNEAADQGATVGLNGPQASGGGAGRHVSNLGAVGARTFTAANAAGRSAAIVPVPGPEAGAGIIPVVLAGLWASRRRARASRASS